ncbi:hypothetical protein [Foetidibacter luteolus]|uniref:hypothetical protein n=1 Tax=Foetidibacter luteolus TaxID=2608880 RepID=UPI00129A4EB3|nr:hypothetical protein [Foetidibacter luteolus]
MLHVKTTVAYVALVLLLISCSKDDKPLPDGPGENMPRYLLDSVAWKDYDYHALFRYNSDSTENRIIYKSAVATDTLRFTYLNKKVETIASTRSPRTSRYFYNSEGKVSKIVMTSLYSPSVTTLEFFYEGKKLSKLDYYITNEAGKKLVWASTYEYNAQSLPAKIVSVSNNGHTVTRVIEGYTEECSFNAWVFISAVSIEEMYELYNYPLLGSMTRFPRKVTTLTNGVPEKVHFFTVEQEDKKLHKMLSRGEFPGNPEYNFSSEAAFFYK